MGLAIVMLIIVAVATFVGFAFVVVIGNNISTKVVPLKVRNKLSIVIAALCVLTLLYTGISVYLDNTISLQARVEQNDYDKVKELLEKGVDPNSDHYALFVGNYSNHKTGRNQPIRIAYRNDNLDIMILLVQYKASDAEGVMYQLIEDGNLEYIKAFVDAGIIENTEPINSYLVYTCNEMPDNAPQILKAMLEHGISRDEISHAIEYIEERLDKDTVSDDYKEKLRELLFILKEY